MKRFVILTSSCLLCACLLIGCQSDNSSPESDPQPEVTTESEVGGSTEPEIFLEPGTVGPDTEFTVSGTNFPANQVILLYISESDINLGPAFAQETIQPDGRFSRTLTAPITWPGANLEGKSKLKLVVEDLYQRNLASADFILDYTGAFKSYVNDTAGYSVSIPADWETSEPQQTPLGELILLGKPPINPGNPGNSKIISTSISALSELEAAQLISCGAIDCDSSIQFSVTSINGLPAKHVTISSDNTPEIEWYFITFGERLIYFTLQDPLSLQPLDPMINSFQLQAFQTDAQDEGNGQEVVSAEVVEEPSETDEALTETDPIEETPESDPEATVEATTIQETPTEIETVDETTVGQTPTETAQPTNEIEASTATPTPNETATAVVEEATEVPTVVPAPTQVLTNEEEEEATRFAELPDPADAGPMQTVINLLTILSRLEEDSSTLDYFAVDTRENIASTNQILPFILMSSRPISFELLRLDQIPVTIEASVRDINGRNYELEFILQKEEERWRILSVRTIQ